MPTPLTIPDTTVRSLVDTFGTPLQIYDGDLIVDNQTKFIRAMANNFPTFRQYFAVKALPNPHILKLLVDHGSYLDCSSNTELQIAKTVGLSGEKIMFTSNYTSRDDLKLALDLGAIINLDDISLIDDLAAVGPSGHLPELLCFRLNPGIGKTDSETVSNVLGGPDAKFGIPPTQIVEAFIKAKELGVKRFGLHMMTGSNVLNYTYWDDLIKILFKNVDAIQKAINTPLTFINIGGGIGIPYKPDQAKFDVEELSNLLKLSINSESVHYSIEAPRLCMENGRFITGPYGWLISKCNVIKNTSQKYYGLDACMANLMRPGMYGAYHHISVLGKDSDQTEKATW
jgi:diaminopimelate decarboxylase